VTRSERTDQYTTRQANRIRCQDEAHSKHRDTGSSRANQLETACYDSRQMYLAKDDRDSKDWGP
jgi:hypothetical protein